MYGNLNMNNFDINNVKDAIMTAARISLLIITSTARISNLNVVNDAIISGGITANKSQNLKDLDVVNKSYLDSRLQNININGLLKTDGSNQMNADLDVGNNKIINLKEPTETETTAAANVSYVKVVVYVQR